MSKTCSDCREEKPKSAFGKVHGYLNKRCRPCDSAYKRTLPSYMDREAARDRKLKARYGISLVEYEGMLRRQGNACAICGNGGKLHVDHCHASGQVRGLLCGSCNRALGLFKDNVGNLANAIGYLNSERK